MTKCTYWMSIPLANKSVEINTREEPVLNSYMIRSLQSDSIALWMELMVKFYSFIDLDRLSTDCLVLQQMIHYWISRLLYNSIRVSNLNCSLSMATQNYLIPSRVNSSFLTKILAGFLMKLSVISRMNLGIVALQSPTQISEGMREKTSLIQSSKPLLNISSASSKIIILRCQVQRQLRFIMSTTLPGVPTTICTPSLRYFLSLAI